VPDVAKNGHHARKNVHDYALIQNADLLIGTNLKKKRNLDGKTKRIKPKRTRIYFSQGQG
jgi:hypothetical protein